MEIPYEYYMQEYKGNFAKQLVEFQMIGEIRKQEFETLLDVGTGDGHFLKNFPDKKAEGIDYSPEMIEFSDMKRYIHLVNIAEESGYVKENKNRFDIITSNYVFLQFKEKELKKAFQNIYQMLKEKGMFYFTMTDPRTRHIKPPGYTLEFSEPYDYNKKDLEFKVLIDLYNGLEDVGIIDIHNPIEVYDEALERTGFKEIKRRDITIYLPERNKEESFAVLYTVRK